MFEFEPIREKTNIIFAHVPKCAGTSLVGYLWGTRPRVRNINYQRVSQEFAGWLQDTGRGSSCMDTSGAATSTAWNLPALITG